MAEKMEYIEALNRLSNHANQPMDEAIPPEESLIYSLWHATRDGKLPNLERLGADVISCLEAINRDINGHLPSNTAGKRGDIDRDLVNVIASIITAGQEYTLLWQKRSLFSASDQEELRRIVWEISHAWSAIIHGDIDSLANDIALQHQTKGI